MIPCRETQVHGQVRSHSCRARLAAVRDVLTRVTFFQGDSMRVVRCIGPIFLLLLTITNLPSSAQSSYGSIVGTVTDPSGAAVGGATVELTNAGTSERRTAT